MVYTQLQLREIFHLEFLRWLNREAGSDKYALKGGVNMRFFFKSSRYSEDIDLDAVNIGKEELLDSVMKILTSNRFLTTMKTFGIDGVAPPNLAKAKQTDTTQRFKTHLITEAGEDLFTKVEFSRRGTGGVIKVEPVPNAVIRAYKVSPLMVPHYDIDSAINQKVGALISRSATQARDIFDLYILSAQHDSESRKVRRLSESLVKEAHNKIYEVPFGQFRDSVIAYLPDSDRKPYETAAAWDEIRLRAVQFLEELGSRHG